MKRVRASQIRLEKPSREANLSVIDVAALRVCEQREVGVLRNKHSCQRHRGPECLALCRAGSNRRKESPCETNSQNPLWLAEHSHESWYCSDTRHIQHCTNEHERE